MSDFCGNPGGKLGKAVEMPTGFCYYKKQELIQKQEERPMDYNKAALEMHESHHGKVGIVSKVEVKTRDDLSTA